MIAFNLRKQGFFDPGPAAGLKQQAQIFSLTGSKVYPLKIVNKKKLILPEDSPWNRLAQHLTIYSGS